MTLPISIVTDEIAQELATCRRFLDEQEVQGVELRMISGRRVPELAPCDRATLRDWVRDGTQVVTVSPGTFKGDVADRARAASELRESLPRAIELALELAAPFVVTFGFDNPTGAAAPEHAIESLRSAARLCGDAGVTLLLENEPGFLAQTAGESCSLVAAVGEPGLGLNWDPANSNEFAPEAVAAAVRAVAPHARHVHVKNGRLAPGQRFAEWCSLTEGDIDWRVCLRALAEHGYEGHLGVETHFEPLLEGSARVLAELRDMLAELG